MDERKRMLATAWRDLAGWHVGMVDTDGEVNDGRANWDDDPERLPDTDAPASWGVWLAWLLGRDLAVDTVPQMPRGCGRFAISVNGGRHHVGPFASALLLATIDDETDGLSTLPPSVTVWREAEQAPATEQPSLPEGYAIETPAEDEWHVISPAGVNVGWCTSEASAHEHAHRMAKREASDG